MHIAHLFTQNVKKVVSVEIFSGGDHVTLEGQNRNGKSSCLDSIMYTLGGTKDIPQDPVNRNAGEKDPKHGTVTLSPDDKGRIWTISRGWTKGKNTKLSVVDQDGFAPSSTQTFLDSLTAGKLIFNPMKFMNAEPKERVEQIKKLVGLDFTKQNEKYQELYKERTGVNSRVLLLKGKVEGNASLVEPTPTRTLDEVKVERAEIKVKNDETREKLEDIKSTEAGIQSEQNYMLKYQNKIVNIESEIERLKEEKIILESKIVKIQEINTESVEYLAEIKKENLKLKPTTYLDDEIDTITANAVNQTNWDNALVTKKNYDKADAESKDITSKMEAVKKGVDKQIAEAKMPIKNLTIDGKNVLYNGIEFDEASQEEQITVTMAIAMAGNPILKVILIRSGSLLDTKSLAYLKEIATKYKFQLWVERVADKASGDENSFFIEDGSIQEEEKK